MEEGADKADIILIKSAWHPHVRGGLSKCVLLIAQVRSVRCGARYSLTGDEFLAENEPMNHLFCAQT